MEYIHRMWGRAIGLTFALPAGFFLLKKWVPKHVKPRLGFYAGIILFQVRKDLKPCILLVMMSISLMSGVAGLVYGEEWSRVKAQVT